MTFYGIRKVSNKESLGFTAMANNPKGDNVDISYTFDISGSNVWLVHEKEIAKKALKDNPVWFNAGYETPEWPNNIKAYDYEIFEVNI